MNTEIFNVKYFKENHDANWRCLIVIYFAFTTLSTVGFGDYVPRCNEERIFVAILLLSGVATFSYVMGKFLDICKK